MAIIQPGYWPKILFLPAGPTQEIPNGQEKPSLPTWVANQNTLFTSSHLFKEAVPNSAWKRLEFQLALRTGSSQIFLAPGKSSFTFLAICLGPYSSGKWEWNVTKTQKEILHFLVLDDQTALFPSPAYSNKLSMYDHL